jgi:hypothetical protein
MTRIRFALAAALLAGSAGCDSGGGIPIGDFGPRIVSAACDIGVRCGTFPDRASCEASVSIDLRQNQADVDAGRLKYDGNAAASCIAAFESTSGLGGCSVTTSLSASEPAACQRIFTGAVAMGGTCFQSIECQSQSCDLSACTGTTACCAGSCILPVTPLAAAIGTPCSTQVSSACVDGAFCQSAQAGGATGICTAKLGAGQPCTSIVGQCASGLVCLDGSGVCGKLPAEGEACSATGRCDLENDYCDPTTGLCAPRVTPGAACPTGNECVGYAFCDQTTLTCVADGSAGDPCNDTAHCLGTLECPAGVCTQPAPVMVCP